MRAIEKHRTRRYPSASEFAADIQRHLSDEPVVASPPSTAYRVGKFVRRHRANVITGGLLAASILVGLAVSVVLYWIAEHQRGVAEWQGYKATLTAARSEIAAFRSQAAKRLLFDSPKRLRGWEWQYLYAAADLSLMMLQSRGDSTYTSRLGFTADSSRMFLSRSNTIHEWDLGMRKEVAVYGPFGAILAMLRNGQRVLARARSGPEHDLELIEPRSGSAIRLSGHEALVTSAAFTRDGSRLVTGSVDGIIRVWNTATGVNVLTIRGPARTERREDLPVDDVLAISPDGARIAYSLGWSIALWDGMNARRIATLRHTDGSLIQAIVFTERGDHIYSASEAIRVWDAANGNQVAEYVAPATAPTRLAVRHPEGRSLAAVSSNGELYVFPIAADTRKTVPLAGLPVAGPAALAFSPDGQYLAAAALSGEVKIWDARTFGGRFYRDAHSPVTMAFSPDRSQAANLTFGGGIELWETLSGRLVQSWAGQKWQISDKDRPPVAVSVRGLVATADKTGLIRIWQTGLHQPRFELSGHRDVVGALAFSKDGLHLVSGSEDGTVLLWDLSTGRERARIVMRGPVWDLDYTLDGNLIAVAAGQKSLSLDDPPLQLIDPFSGAVVRRFPHAGRSRSAVRYIAFSRDGHRVAGVRFDGSGVVWQVDTGRVVGMLQNTTVRAPVGIDFSPDGTRIVTAQADQTMTFWDTARFQAVITLPLQPGWSLSFSPDGRRLYAHDSSAVIYYTTETSYSAQADELVARLSRAPKLVCDVRLRIENDPILSAHTKQAALEIVNRDYSAAEAVWPALDEALTSPGQSSFIVALALMRAETMQRWLPDDANARARLGLAYFRNDATVQAIRTLERPDQWTPPGRPPGAEAAVLAMSYYKLKQVDKARWYLGIARERFKELQDSLNSIDSPPSARVRSFEQEVSRFQKLVHESESLVLRRNR